jgi:ketosteroid isomerase-like protein
MTTERTRAVRSSVALIERLYDAFRRRDLPEIFGVLAPDVEIRQSREVPWGGEYKGHEEAAVFFGKLTQSITSAVTLDGFVDAGEQVVALGRTRGTVNANGAAFDVRVAHVWTVKVGRVTRVEYYIDDPAMLAALG